MICGTRVFAAEPVTTGTIEGTVEFAGTPKDYTLPDFSEDPFCAEIQSPTGITERQNLIVNDNGTLQNVLVYVVEGFPDGKKWGQSSGTLVLERNHCEFSPHILPLQTGQSVQIVNQDPTLTNFHWRSGSNGSYNFSLKPNSKAPDAVQFNKPNKPVLVSNAIQPWMQAYIAVFDHPYYSVSDSTGKFRIDGLPVGEYTLEAWHEKYKPVRLPNVRVGGEDQEKPKFEFTSTGASNAGFD